MQTTLSQYLFRFMSILLLAVYYSCNESTSDAKRVLVIQSYEPEYDGYNGTEHMIRNEFRRNHIKADIRTFYLDCETYLDKEEKARIYNYLDSLLDWRLDIILTYDDQACYSYMNSGHPLSKQIPTIFAGVNYPNWTLLEQHSNVTGYWDHPEYLKTVDMSNEIFGPMKVNFWTDDTFLGRQTTIFFLKELKAHGINHISNNYFTIDDNNYRYELTRDSTFTEQRTLTVPPKKTFYTMINGRAIQSTQLLWALSGLARYSVFYKANVILHQNVWDYLPVLLPLQ
ncbi:MAG: hypothetical protein LUH01_03555 [Parabacteroides gordonii]|nr:hypothetical protein [Parabacteroides gordonii]